MQKKKHFAKKIVLEMLLDVSYLKCYWVVEAKSLERTAKSQLSL